MGIFSRILDKLRGHSGATPPQQGTTTQPTGGAPQQNQYAPGQNAQQQATAGQPVLQNVDVDAVLRQMATQKGGGGNYRESIVDLLKLLDLDSDLNARKELAQELGVNAGAHGSAEQNIALHKAVMRKLAENGGKVPDSLKD
ncbi:MAG TPA: DUF3597 domain-containing protein [Usitatibacter sp.]|nr:DUF3597 domain-containing protein [Usitatibacter sp.]